MNILMFFNKSTKIVNIFISMGRSDVFTPQPLHTVWFTHDVQMGWVSGLQEKFLFGLYLKPQGVWS